MRAVAIITGPYTHLDHLGVLASILDIPLVLTDAKSHRIAKEQYPMIPAKRIDLEDLSLSFLAENYDVIFHSGRFWMAELDFLFRSVMQRRMRFVFCPHGNSEKGRSVLGKIRHPEQDLVLHYGEQMYDLLQKNGAASKVHRFIRTGNYRNPFFHKHKEALAKSIAAKINLPLRQRTIFYAPTWPSAEHSSSFFDYFSDVIKTLPSHLNLLIKLHPFLEKMNPGLYWKILEQIGEKENVKLIDDVGPIYPLIELCDLYLGDLSSIGYDCLLFNKPLFFLRPESQVAKSSLLFSCGMEIPKELVRKPFEWIEEHLERNQREKAKIRLQTYTYAFGEEVSPAELKRNIFTTLNEGRKDRHLADHV